MLHFSQLKFLEFRIELFNLQACKIIVGLALQDVNFFYTNGINIFDNNLVVAVGQKFGAKVWGKNTWDGILKFEPGSKGTRGRRHNPLNLTRTELCGQCF